jgi:hypothetical protein
LGALQSLEALACLADPISVTHLNLLSAAVKRLIDKLSPNLPEKAMLAAKRS